MLYINIPVFTFQDKKINNYYLVHASDKGRDKYLPDDRVFKRHYEFFILSEFLHLEKNKPHFHNLNEDFPSYHPNDDHDCKRLIVRSVL